MYKVTKTYGHDLGLSASFRQHKALSHCRFIHGYAMSIKLTFAAQKLDENNWVMDFGGLKSIKAWLVETFDHKMLVAKDDPYLEALLALQALEVADIVVVDFVGCEGFSRMVAAHVEAWLYEEHGYGVQYRGLKLESVEVREHGANSAIYQGEA